MIGFGHDIGFSKVTAYEHYSDTTWGEHVAAVKGKPRQPVEDEQASGKDVVKVYPVRTELSKFLTSDADCAVVIVPSLEKEQGAIPKMIRADATEHVGKLLLRNKNRIAFYLEYVPADQQQKLVPEFRDLAESLGFKTSSVTFR